MKALSTQQIEGLKFLANGGEQIQARTAKALEARGLVTTDGLHRSSSGWVKATLTDKGREIVPLYV